MRALDHITGTVVGQESIGEKTNEIPHFSPLLDQLGDLTGTIVTDHALHTQRAHAQDLHLRGDHYVFTVKTNQPRLRKRISSQTWSTRKVTYSSTERARGRTVTWQATAQRAQDWIDFPHAAQIVHLVRDRHDHATGHKSREQVYLITSLPPGEATAQQLAQYIRGHWGIENRLHWVRDTTFGEDASQIRTGTGAHTMASMRNHAINIHRFTDSPAQPISPAPYEPLEETQTLPEHSSDFEMTCRFWLKTRVLWCPLARTFEVDRRLG